MFYVLVSENNFWTQVLNQFLKIQKKNPKDKKKWKIHSGNSFEIVSYILI